MTIADFRSKVRGFRRAELLRGGVFLALLGAAAFPTLFVARQFDRVGFDAMAVVVVVLSYAVIAALMFHVLAPLRRMQMRKLQGNCPACGKLLMGERSRAVLASGKCPDCGRQILE